MSRKSLFLILMGLLFLTANVYLFYSAPVKLDVNNENNEVALEYSNQEMFSILAAVNDKARTLYTKSIVGGGKKVGLHFHEDWESIDVEAGPLPALFLRETSLLKKVI